MRNVNRWLLIAVIVFLVVVNGAQAVFGIQSYPDPPTVERNGSENRTVVTTNVGAPAGESGLYLYEGSERTALSTKYFSYFDVDPAGPNTVEFVAANKSLPECGQCTRNYLVRYNIKTGEETILRTAVERGTEDREWHDADRIDNTTYLFVDMTENEVYRYNTTLNIKEWSWPLQSVRGPNTGQGIGSGDWSHMNDVEVVRNGTQYMVSLRNQNEVIFINAETGNVTDTIGGNGRDVLFRQHQPDYIPRERGGPAVIVADSHNDRIVEYEKRDGSWVKTWEWRDRYMSWPRDADRLPNGHTLIVDSNAGRVLEINKSGVPVWSVRAPDAYDAERLGTGDESAGGTAASELGLESRVEGRSHSMFSALFGERQGSVLPWFFPWLDWVDGVLVIAGLLMAYFEGFFLFTKYIYDPYLDDYL